MKRLTERHYKVSDGAYLKCSEECAALCCDDCDKLDNIVDRLAAYEDTGLEPQTISEILDSVSEWYDAHKEGRLLVLSGIKNHANDIRQMSDEELAEFLWSIGSSPFSGNVYLGGKYLFFTGDGNGWLDWLKQGVESDA